MFTPHDHVSDEDRKVWSKAVWQVSIPPKMRVFLWRACTNIIPTMRNLREHHVPVDGICELCHNRWATTEHALLFCPKIREMWKRSRYWRVLKGKEMVSLMEIALFLAKELESDEYAVWCVLVWKVWNYAFEVGRQRRMAGVYEKLFRKLGRQQDKSRDGAESRVWGEEMDKATRRNYAY